MTLKEYCNLCEKYNLVRYDVLRKASDYCLLIDGAKVPIIGYRARENSERFIWKPYSLVVYIKNYCDNSFNTNSVSKAKYLIEFAIKNKKRELIKKRIKKMKKDFV